jgi:carboxyl-terminal processing protease
MNKVFYIGWLTLMLLSGALLAAAQDSAATLTAEQTELNLESFDYVWSTIANKHFDTTMGGLDWLGIRDELRPQVENATTMAEAREPFQELLSRLGLSHYQVIPQRLYENIDQPAGRGDEGGKPGFEVCVVDTSALVTEVVEGSAAAAAGVGLGWEALEIDGEEIPPLFLPIIEKYQDSPKLELFLERVVVSRISGAIGDTVDVVFLDGNNERRELALELSDPPGKKILFGNLPPIKLTTEIETLRDNIGYFSFSFFFDPVLLMSRFGEFMNTFMDAPGIVIDIRGNGGGIGGLTMGLAGWLVQEKNVYLGTFSTRGTELKLVVNPRAQTYDGPVAILVDGNSASASEFFAGGLQDIGRARIFGTRTVGMALPSMIERLPNGDGFQYVFANYISASGRSLEGDGVIPDVEVTHTREALLNGRDLMLEAAVEWIMNENKTN